MVASAVLPHLHGLHTCLICVPCLHGCLTCIAVLNGQECTSFGKDGEESWKLLLGGNIGGWRHMESKADLLHEELQ